MIGTDHLAPALPDLPYEAWEPTKTTLHLWSQIVGKIRLAATPQRNHWWNVTLVFTPRGLAARGMQHAGIDFEIEFDFIAHRLVLRTATGFRGEFALHDGLAVADFFAQTMDLLARASIDLTIRYAVPYGVPIATPFARDTEHAAYDRIAVERWWTICRWTTHVLDRFTSRFSGKQSPPHLFWHSFDLAMARYSGRPAVVRDGASHVEREAYNAEVIAFGFWPGDPRIMAPTFYTYTAPEPSALSAEALRPEQAYWAPSGSGHIGALAYDIVRTSPDPAFVLLDFFQSGYEAGMRTAHWDVTAITVTNPG